MHDLLPQDFPFFPDEFNLNTTGFSACVAAVKCRPVVHNCVVVFFWSSETMDCMLRTFKIRIPLMQKKASVVWQSGGKRMMLWFK